MNLYCQSSKHLMRHNLAQCEKLWRNSRRQIDGDLVAAAVYPRHRKYVRSTQRGAVDAEEHIVWHRPDFYMRLLLKFLECFIGLLPHGLNTFDAGM